MNLFKDCLPKVKYSNELKTRVEERLSTRAVLGDRERAGPGATSTGSGSGSGSGSGTEHGIEWGDGLRKAAVVIGIVDDAEGRACFLLTRRSMHLSNHPGQWALPGGMLEPGEDPATAALRELHEELGLELGQEDLLGRLDEYPTRSGFSIAPFVAWAPAGVVLQPDPEEVDSVYRVPLMDLAIPDLVHTYQIPESDRPVLSLNILGDRIHAPTAAIIYQFCEWALHDRATRVEHFEQPRFAWR